MQPPARTRLPPTHTHVLPLPPTPSSLLLSPPTPQACNRMAMHCVPLYDSLGENAIEYIVNHRCACVCVWGGGSPGLGGVCVYARACVWGGGLNSEPIP